MTNDIRVLCAYDDNNLPPYGNHITTEDSELDNEQDEEYPFVVRFDHRTALLLGTVLSAGLLTILRVSAKIGKKLLS